MWARRERVPVTCRTRARARPYRCPTCWLMGSIGPGVELGAGSRPTPRRRALVNNKSRTLTATPNASPLAAQISTRASVESVPVSTKLNLANPLVAPRRTNHRCHPHRNHNNNQPLTSSPRWLPRRTRYGTTRILAPDCTTAPADTYSRQPIALKRLEQIATDVRQPPPRAGADRHLHTRKAGD